MPQYFRFFDTFTSAEKRAASVYVRAMMYFSKEILGRLLLSHSWAASPSRAAERGAEKADVDGSIPSLGPPHPKRLSGNQRVLVLVARPIHDHRSSDVFLAVLFLLLLLLIQHAPHHLGRIAGLGDIRPSSLAYRSVILILA
jgi:hypothetical protein